ncbi:MAG: diaminopimelate epimerase, partial [Candidatus Heimdallarchaeota archaeon]|nr:diaminopimelate epimerase [Candidatus Heimdallarchaeota archaeon]
PSLLQKEKISVNGYKGNLINIGNPHFVIFVDNIDSIQTAETGKKIESDKQFKNGVNVELIQMISSSEVKMKVWERGSGVTLSCGTGACASVYAGIVNDLLSDSVLLHSPGGQVAIDFDGKNIFLTGDVEFVFSGIVEV